MNIIRTTFGYFLEPLHQDTIVHICMSPPQPSALVLAVPRSCRFHKSFPTSRATVLLDPVVALHVSHQTCFLNELLSAFLTFIISYSSVNLFVTHANTCESKSFWASNFSTSIFPLSCVFPHVLFKAVFVMTILLTDIACVQTCHVVFVIYVIYQGWSWIEFITTVLTIIFLGATVH